MGREHLRGLDNREHDRDNLQSFNVLVAEALAAGVRPKPPPPGDRDQSFETDAVGELRDFFRLFSGHSEVGGGALITIPPLQLKANRSSIIF